MSYKLDSIKKPCDVSYNLGKAELYLLVLNNVKYEVIIMNWFRGDKQIHTVKNLDVGRDNRYIPHDSPTWIRITAVLAKEGVI